MSKIIRINEVTKFNSENFKKGNFPDVFYYLDTGSLTKNKIENIQEFYSVSKDIPSRAQRKVKRDMILYSTVRPNQEHHGFIENNFENIVASTGFATIEVIDKEVNPKFLYFLITQKHITDYLHTKGMSAVSAYPSISPNDIGNLKFRIPELETQTQIAKVLSDLDAKIELNNKINAELESMAKLIYDYWFVQFDFPNEEGKPYKSSGGKMVWNEELKREIPEGWEVGTLLDIATFTNGIACQKFRPVNNEKYYKVIKIREMSDGFKEDYECVSQNIPEKVIVNNGDVLFSWSATLEVKIWTGGIGALNQHIFKITSNKFPKSFYYFELLRYLQHFKMIAELRKTTMGHITQDHLKQSRIVIPNIELIKSLEIKLNPILNKIIKSKEENQKLSELRDWLLPMLMNGQVKVG